jgi:hypothetical protein
MKAGTKHLKTIGEKKTGILDLLKLGSSNDFLIFGDLEKEGENHFIVILLGFKKYSFMFQ